MLYRSTRLKFEFKILRHATNHAVKTVAQDERAASGPIIKTRNVTGCRTFHCTQPYVGIFCSFIFQLEQLVLRPQILQPLPGFTGNLTSR